MDFCFDITDVSIPAKCITPDEVFGPNGLMSSTLSDYQPRESQVLME
jgi:hypothetical protein